jgi:hypothetical protein
VRLFALPRYNILWLQHESQPGLNSCHTGLTWQPYKFLESGTAKLLAGTHCGVLRHSRKCGTAFV